jgi:hypothetical protein
MLVLVVALLVACGSPSPHAGASPTPSPAARPVSVSPSPIVAPVPASPVSAVDCPSAIRNVSGSYSFICPAGWKALNCEATSFSGSFTWLINPDACRSEAYGARSDVMSATGDHSNDPDNQIGPYKGQLQSSQTVIVAGVTGVRRTYLVTAQNPLPPPNRTVQVRYVFVSGGRTYWIDYDRYPGEADLTSAFDTMVSSTFRFSA